MPVAEKFENLNNMTETDCTFNGRLRVYLFENQIDDPIIRSGFEMLVKQDPEVNVIVNYRQKINKNTISNQIIRYKDIFKLEGKPLLFPYIVYTRRNNMERGMLVFPYDQDSFLYAKGAYYCLTEQYSEFESEKNELITVSTNKAEEIPKAFDALFHMHAGALQRRIDRGYYRDYDELKAKAEAAADHLNQEAHEKLPAMEERTGEIYKLVVSWFLLKKVLYVQYMMDKSALVTIHEGSVRKQRNQAKINADSITFIAYSDLWRMSAEQR